MNDEPNGVVLLNPHTGIVMIVPRAGIAMFSLPELNVVVAFNKTHL